MAELSAASSGGSFWLAAATAWGGSSGEKMRFLAAWSTGSLQALSKHSAMTSDRFTKAAHPTQRPPSLPVWIAARALL